MLIAPLIASPVEISLSPPPGSSLYSRLHPEVEASNDKYCAYERLALPWSTRRVPIDGRDAFDVSFDLLHVAHVELVKEGSDGAEVQAVPLGHSEDRGVVVKSWEESSEPTGDSTMSLSCDSNGGPACTIAMKSVLIEELQDDTPYTHVLVLTFNADVDLDKAEANIVGREQVL